MVQIHYASLLDKTGVATYCRDGVIPFKAEEGITGMLNSVSDRIESFDLVQNHYSGDELRDLDAEGRCVMTLHQFKVRFAQR